MPISTSTRSLTDRRLSNASVTTPRAESSPVPSDFPDGNTEDESGDVSPAPHSENEDTPKRKKYQKSPLLTAHRLSTTSLDEVNLAGNKDEDESLDANSPGTEPPADSPRAVSVDSTTTMQSMSSTLMSSLPSVPWPAPPKPAPAAAAAPAPAPAPPPLPPRKTGPFAWLSRSSTSGKDIKSPPVASSDGRRNTAASVSTLNTLEEGDSISIGSKRPTRNSLKDQFKILRMREEAPDADQASIASGKVSVSTGLASPAEEKDVLPTPSPLSAGAGASFPSVNPNLPPGTVSGISTSATDAAVPVDWELWEKIVNHGPEALSGANSEELNAAIKRGIPQTIRGVIWQVLADSRNPELEETYKELVVRGTDKERHASLSGHHSGIASEKESLASSRSSIRSDHSGSPSPSSQTTNSPVSHEKETDSIAAESARKKKIREDAEAIRKLEKTIRRDLGSRTSYSKYFVSQGSQESLFGLCKAYALYDEAVGYAQGINFIAMPLLFNVSSFFD
jgi:Rab-GTPase-TBC domain